MQYRGTLINIKPRPLSISLLKAATDECIFDFDKVIKPLLETLTDQTPYLRDLGDTFIKQVTLAMLSDNHDLKRYVNKLLGNDSPFAQAENLLTSWGSIVLRRITEIAPQISIQILKSALYTYSNNDIFQINGNIRRNIVFALEYLCLDKETFEDAAEIMLRFGIAETESLVNNSQEVFIKFFTLYLSGTEANYEQRIRFLKQILNKYYPDAAQIIIRAITQAFYLGPYFRLSNARHQLNDLSDYQPKTNKEVINYWERLITILLSLINNKDTNIKLIIEALNNIILQSLLKAKKIDEANQIIEDIKNQYPEEKFIETIKRLENYKEFDTEINHEHIDLLINKLSPIVLIDKIELHIINKKYLTDLNKTQEHEIIQSELARQLMEDKTNENIITKLIGANTYNLWEFGKKIAEINSEYAKQVIQDFTEKYLSLNDLDSKSPFFIMGLMHGVNDRSVFSSLLKELLRKEAYKLVFIVTSMYSFTFEDFTKLVSIAKSNDLPDDYFGYLHFQHFSVTDKIEIVNTLWSMNKICKSKCIEIISFGLNNNKDSNNLLINFWKLIKADNIFTLDLNSHLDYQVNMILQKLLDKGKAYATIIARQLYEYCKINESDYPKTHYWNNLFIRLINEHYELMWNKYLGKIFLDSWQGEFFVVHTIASRKLSIICNTPEKIENLVKWCAENKKKKAHVRIARNILLRVENKAPKESENEAIRLRSGSLGQDTPSIQTKWSDAILALLEEYDDDLFLGAIITNLSSYFLAGDQASSYYFKCSEYLEELSGKFSSRIDQWIISESKKFKLMANKNKQQEEEFSVIQKLEIY